MSGTVSSSNVASQAYVPPQQQNLLQQAGQGLGLIQGLNQVRRENETFGAQQTIGRAMQQAMDPATGQVNHQRFQELLAGNPMAAFLAPQALIQARQLEGATTQVQAGQAQLGMLRLNNVRQSVQGLLANPQVSREDVLREITNLLRLPSEQRPFDEATAAAQLATLPSDPAGVRRWLMQRMASTDQGLQQLQQFLPRPAMINTGPASVGVDMNPVSPTYGQQSGPAVTMGSSPQDMNELVDAIGPRGERIRVPRWAIAPMVTGAGTQVPGTGPGQPPASPSIFGNGRYPQPQGQTPSQPAAGAPQETRPAMSGGAAGPSTLPPGGFAASLPPGVSEAQTLQAARAAEAGTALLAAADEIPQIQGVLQNMDNLVRQFSSGQTADWQRIVGSLGTQVLPTALQGGIFDPSRAASQEEFNKQAMQLAQSQFRMLGGTGTDSQLASTMMTSPNELYSREGNRGIIAMLRGNYDALGVKARAWADWQRQGNGPETYFQFESQFNRNFNPRVFQMQYLPPHARETALTNMSNSDRVAYRRDFLHSVANNWIRVDGITPDVAREMLQEEQQRQVPASPPRSGPTPPPTAAVRREPLPDLDIMRDPAWVRQFERNEREGVPR